MNSLDMPVLVRQEIPYDDPESKHFFRNPPVVTTATLKVYPEETITQCMRVLHAVADREHGLGFLQVFKDLQRPDLHFTQNVGSVSVTLSSDD